MSRRRDPTAADVRALARRPSRLSLRRLLAIAKDPTVPGMTRVRAASAILTIAYGPVPETPPTIRVEELRISAGDQAC